MSFATAMAWIARLASGATAIAALELIVAHRAWSERGVYRWSTLRREYSPAGARLAGLVFATPGMWIVLAVQLASALALPWLVHPVWPWLAFATTLAISMRFRGTFNGGSDAMLIVVLLGLAIARSGAREIGLGYIAAQLVLSYVLAGVAKVREPRWREGTALAALVALPSYGAPPALLAYLTKPVLARNAGYALLAFELGFPIALVDPTACRVLLVLAAVFHLGNA
ncbi:MAG TPA: hypothetical protein VFQ65_22460, partial [Kofleriaceae bacterium]|nr:hypothetical protein [Kofleriaceae bacterium]